MSATRKRASARGWLSRAVKHLDELVPLGPDCDLVVLEEALADFNKKFDAVDEAQAAFEVEVEEGQLEAEIEAAGELRDAAIKSRQAATKLHLALTKDDVSDGGSSSATRQSVHSAASNDVSSVRLPKLELPKFDGTLTKWQPFWDNFSAIIDCTELPLVSKFTYLQSLLEGEPKRTIDGLALSNSNYTIACNLLKERYGRRERIVFAHIQGLLNMGISGHEKSAPTSDLRKLQEELLAHIRSLEAFDIQGSNYGVVLTPVILSRLPSDIRLEWARTGEGKEDDLDYLLLFLKQEIERRERSEAFKQLSQSGGNRNSNSASSNKSHVEKVKTKSSKNPTASALQVSSVATSCGFCSKSHATDACPDVAKLDIPGRQKKISEARLCFRCLVRGHVAKGCLAKCSKCSGSHHLMCCFGGKKDNDNATGTVSATVESQPKIAMLCSDKVKKDNVNMYTVLQTARVLVCGERTVEATLLFDSGSDRTFITSNLVKRANLKCISSVSMTYAPFGGGKSGRQLRDVYELSAKGVYGGCEGFKSLTATEVPVICSPLSRPTLPSNLFNSLPKLEFADDYSRKGTLTVDVLVGLDQYWRLIKSGVIRIADGTVAQETEFGWILSGSYGDSSLRSTEAFQLLSLGDVSEDVIRRFWDIESIGIAPIESFPEVDKCWDNFERDITWAEGRYEVALPWKSERPTLLNNEVLARRRLGSLSRKLDKDPPLKVRYNLVLSDLESSRVIEEVLEDVVPYDVFYLPHRPVVKEASSTTKVRPVFDASASGFNGVSLNDCLEPGPSLIPCLSEVLLRFRRWKVALTADITKAFLQIGIRREDRDVHRFLWNDGGVERKMRFLRVTFGVTSSPFLLNATVKHHLSLFPKDRVIEELGSNLYVDDWLSGADSASEAVEMFEQAQSVMAQAGLTLSKWNSNSKVVCDSVGSLLNEGGSTKILGVVWLPEEDCFGFDGVDLPEMIVPTKRVVLSFIARSFDPLGFLTPYIMVAKVLFQELWVLGLTWDEDIPVALSDRFQNWLLGLEDLKKWRLSRPYADLPWGEVKSGIHLHAFGDASEKGYGAVVYLCVRLPDGEFSSSLVMSKAKVAPLKRLTLPRLELLGGLLAARLLRFVRQALMLEESTTYSCWTDSTVALAWIRGDPNGWKQFVANRVREIQDLTDPANWSHCPGKDNPADLTTRGILAEQLVKSDLWLNGPPWLGNPPRVLSEEVEGPDTEVERVSLVCVSAKVEEIYEFERCSSFTKSMRIVAWIRRFVHNVRFKNDRWSGCLSYDELSSAKIAVFRNVQCVAFMAEIEVLEKSRVLPKGSPLRNADPFIAEDGLLRVKGRLQLSDLTYEEKHPIILPNGHVSKLIVHHQHLLLKHAGVDSMVTSLRASFWILGLRRLAKGVKRECFACQRVDASACNQPPAPLPKLRVTEAPPFTVTGVDFMGHLFCADFPGKKFYVCLFTCAVVRAVHLELTDSLSTPQFLLALRRFAARRGLPSVLYSDNARTFQGAETLLSSYFGHLRPDWKFIAPRSPWWGGFWERLVGSVKVALKKSLGTRCLTRCELETTLLEIEGCINSRPLCFVGDVVDCSSPLTPNHFLLGKGAGFQARVIEDLDAVSPKVLEEREQLRQQRLDIFWSIWRNQYLVSLPAVIRKMKSRGSLQVGSVVLIREDNVPRMQWDLGVVLEQYPGKDNIVRSVKLHTSKGPRVRAVQRLYDLELVTPEPTVPPVPSKVLAPEVLAPSPEVLAPSPEVLVPSPAPEARPETRTQSGRIVKAVDKLNL